jgi:hypothetical protein
LSFTSDGFARVIGLELFRRLLRMCGDKAHSPFAAVRDRAQRRKTVRGFDRLPCALTALLAFAASAGDAPRNAARLVLPSADESLGMEAYRAFRLRDNLVLEVSAQSDDAMDFNGGAGVRTSRLVVDGGSDTVSVKAVGDLPRPELLSWRPNRPVFDTQGPYHGDPRQVRDVGVVLRLSF